MVLDFPQKAVFLLSEVLYDVLDGFTVLEGKATEHLPALVASLKEKLT